MDFFVCREVANFMEISQNCIHSDDSDLDRLIIDVVTIQENQDQLQQADILRRQISNVGEESSGFEEEVTSSIPEEESFQVFFQHWKKGIRMGRTFAQLETQLLLQENELKRIKEKFEDSEKNRLLELGLKEKEKLEENKINLEHLEETSKELHIRLTQMEEEIQKSNKEKQDLTLQLESQMKRTQKYKKDFEESNKKIQKLKNSLNSAIKEMNSLKKQNKTVGAASLPPPPSQTPKSSRTLRSSIKKKEIKDDPHPINDSDSFDSDSDPDYDPKCPPESNPFETCKPKPFVCQESGCSGSFPVRYKLLQHEWEVHRIKSSEYKGFLVNCPKCGKEYRNRQNFDKHLKRINDCRN